MDVREALYTTRAMRRVKPDPIPADVQMRILDAAIRAPSGGNSQNWHFLLVDDPAVRGKLGPIYRDCMSMLWKTIYKQRLDAMEATPNDPESIQFRKVYNSANWLAENFETYPLLLMGFAQSDPSGGSIYPALWNAMLAARAEGVGSALTSVILFKWPEVKAILGVPDGFHDSAVLGQFRLETGRHEPTEARAIDQDQRRADAAVVHPFLVRLRRRLDVAFIPLEVVFAEPGTRLGAVTAGPGRIHDDFNCGLARLVRHRITDCERGPRGPGTSGQEHCEQESIHHGGPRLGSPPGRRRRQTESTAGQWFPHLDLAAPAAVAALHDSRWRACLAGVALRAALRGAMRSPSSASKRNRLRPPVAR